MALFSLMAKLGLDLADFQSGLKRGQSLAVGFSNELKATLAGIFTTAAVTAYTKKILDTADNIRDLSDQLGITTEEVQRLNYIADDSGVAFDKWAAAIGKVGNARDEALGGGEKAEKLRRIFEKFGVTNADLANSSLRSFDILKKIAESAVDLTPQRQAELVDLLGEKSFRLVSSLQQLNAELPIQIVSDAELAKLDEAAKKVKLLQGEVDAYAATMLAKTLQGFESNMKGRDSKLGPLAGIAAIMDTASEFIANAFGKTLEAENRFAPADLDEALKKRREAFTAGRSTLEQFGPLQAGQTWEMLQSGKSEKEKTQKAERAARFDRPSTGSLASIGGLYFGADYNTRLMSTAEKQVRELEKISTNTKDTAERLAE